MSLRDVKYKDTYISGVDNLVKDFYIPTLEKSILYQRRTGYFNSRALAIAARGLRGLLLNGGRMQLLCSIQLDRYEEDVLNDPHDFLDRTALDIVEALNQPYDEIEHERLSIMAEMLARGLLEIKVAIPHRRGGIYHEKAGIFRDREGDIVAFNGSGNETPGGWFNNTESFHVFRSWRDSHHIEPEIETFDKLWSNHLKGTDVYSLPAAIERKLIEFRDYYREGIDERVDPRDMVQPDVLDWEWTPELAYIFDAPRLFNKHEFAYSETAVKPYQHQDFVASTVLEDWPPRYLLADEVGLGKTIEAGLIIKGFLAAGRINRMLILAPKNILKQWQEELWTKFSIEAWRLDGKQIVGPKKRDDQPAQTKLVDSSNPFRSAEIMLVSSQLLRLDERQEQVLELDYDMVLLDEAHHARARSKLGQRLPNKLLNVLEELRFRTQGLIFLTATPIQLDRRELWDLLGLLELPGGWQSEANFDKFFEQINATEPDWEFLFRMVGDYVSQYDIDRARIDELKSLYRGMNITRLTSIMRNTKTAEAESLTREEQEVLRLLCFRHTPLARMVFRNSRELLRKYREEGSFEGSIADRETHAVSLTLKGSRNVPQSEAGVYAEIDTYLRDFHASYQQESNGLGFVMVTYRKRLTSSFYALRISFETRLEKINIALETGNFSELFRGLEEEDELDLPTTYWDSEIGKIRHLESLVRDEKVFLERTIPQLELFDTDTKFERLERLLNKLLIHEGHKQVIIFTQFSDTVDYLIKKFESIYGDRIGSFTGGGGKYREGGEWIKCTKRQIQASFQNNETPLSILFCTDAASEGLNLQSCDVMVNYDIPWNPMRIEQRIGRIDRIGQMSKLVHAYTLFYEGTVEQDVYERCMERIDLFRSVLGFLQPILRDIEDPYTNWESPIDRIADTQTVAEREEELRIMHLLNSYSPRLLESRMRAPIKQSELESVMVPRLLNYGWEKAGAYLSKDSQRITLDSTAAETTGDTADLITPTSEINKLFGNLPEQPEIIRGKNDVFRMQIKGRFAYCVNVGKSYCIVENFSDLEKPSGQKYSSIEQVKIKLGYEILKVRKAKIMSERIAWENRFSNWQVRVRMYLERVAEWVWRDKRRQSTNSNYLNEAWMEYRNNPKRRKFNELIDMVTYTPNWSSFTPKRGRVSTKSPRRKDKEKRMGLQYEKITKQIERTSKSLKSFDS